MEQQNKQQYSAETEIFKKKEVKTASNAVAFALLGLFAIMFFWANIYLKITYWIGIPADRALKISEDPFISQAIQIVVSCLMLFVPFCAVARQQMCKITETASLRPAKRGYTVPFIAIGIGFCLFASMAADIVSGIFRNLGIIFPTVQTELPGGINGFFLMVISSAVVPALAEEFAIRGIVLGILRRYGEGFSIIASSVVFGLMHANAIQIPFAFLVGILLAFVTVKSGSLWPAILIHFVNNFISVVFSYLSELLPSGVINIGYIIIMALSMIVTITAAVVVGGRKDLFTLEKTGEIGAGRAIKWFISSPVVIIAAVISVVISFFAR